MRKTIFTLNIDNYAPEITALTYPLMRYYAERIGADFQIITERRFPEWPIPYEKMQLYRLSQGNDWSIYFDSDTLIHPELIDVTQFIPRDTVANNGSDFSAVRHKYDKYFFRDGRNIGTCGWCIIASDWCTDIWRPLDDMTPEEAIDRCWPTVNELNTVVDRAHLVDDFAMSRNVAKFGLKYTTLIELFTKLGFRDYGFFWHQYTIPIHEKVRLMQETLEKWNVPKILTTAYAEQYIHG